VTASYAGDGNFAVSTSAGVPHTVGAAATTTTITGHSPDPSVVTQDVAVTFTVTSSGGTPTGNVTVSDGTVTCTGSVAAGGCTLTPITPGPKTLVATYAGDGNFAGSTSDGVSHTVNLSGSPSASRSSVSAAPSPITASSGDVVSTIVVTVRDAFGNAVSGATVTLSATGTGNTLTPSSGTTGSDGVMTGTLSSMVAGTKTITATVGSVTIDNKPSVTVDPATAAQLVFTTQPADVQGGILAPVVVSARDQFGNAATGFGGNVSMAIGRDASLLGAHLGGTTLVAAIAGVATFGELTIDQLGVGYTLRATADGITAESEPFTVLTLSLP